MAAHPMSLSPSSLKRGCTPPLSEIALPVSLMPIITVAAGIVPGSPRGPDHEPHFVARRGSLVFVRMNAGPRGAMFAVSAFLGERPVKMHIAAVHIHVLAGDMTSLA